MALVYVPYVLYITIRVVVLKGPIPTFHSDIYIGS